MHFLLKNNQDQIGLLEHLKASEGCKSMKSPASAWAGVNPAASILPLPKCKSFKKINFILFSP